jgi:predicted ATPase
MLNFLRIQNFKAFEDVSLQFKPLTLMAGLNGMGKSSVLQSLLLLRQSYEQRLLSRGLALNGDLVKIGTAKDALFEKAESDDISFELGFKPESIENLHWIYQCDRKLDVIKTKHAPKISDDLHNLCLFNDYFHYLQSERLGPRTVSEMSDYLVRQHFQIGISGEYTAHFLATFGNDRIHSIDRHNKDSNRDKVQIPSIERPHRYSNQDKVPQTSHPQAKSLLLKHQVEAWMGEISPGTQIKISSNPDIDLMSLQYSFVMGKDVSNPYRSTNVGFGISYTLPIVVAVLASAPGSLILIENPEAHLHPRGQSKIGELLALAASYGIQIIIETHSDHVLNGIRVAVHGGKIKPDDVQLHYLQRTTDRERASTEIISPKIDRNGRIDRWPDGFFDEWERNLDILLEPARDED